MTPTGLVVVVNKDDEACAISEKRTTSNSKLNILPFGVGSGAYSTGLSYSYLL